MYFATNQSSLTDSLASRYQQLCGTLSQFSTFSHAQTLEAGEILELEPNFMYRLRSGSLTGQLEGNVWCSYEEGDWLGFFDRLNETVEANEETQIDRLKLTDLYAALSQSPNQLEQWSRWLFTLTGLIAQLAPQQQSQQNTTKAGFIHVNAGALIIREGDAAEDVFTIIEGQAAAYVDGIKVGDVLKDEIFGAMAVFTGSPRTASVIAETDCTVMVVPQEHFESLIQSQPKIALTLIENMARQIRSLNDQLLHLQNQPELIKPGL